MHATAFHANYKSFVAFALCVRYVAAISSLYIPGFDPQPVTVNELGVGSDGATTYVIAPGVSSGTLDDSGFYGPATLVLGASTAALTYIDPNYGITLYENCEYSDGIAVCNDVAGIAGPDGYTTSEIITESAQAFPIQGGGYATGTAAIALTTTAPVVLPSGTETEYASASAGSSAGVVIVSSSSGSGPASETSSPSLGENSSASDGGLPSMTRLSTSSSTSSAGASQQTLGTTSHSGVAKVTVLPFLSLALMGLGSVFVLFA